MEKKENVIEKLVSLAKRRGFIFPSSEIYGGFAAIYDYGHYGILLKNNIQQAWWKEMVQLRDDVLGLDSAIFMHPTTWVASGHVGGFDDPQVDCRKCKARMRADHMLEAFDINADKAPIDFINKELDKLREAGKLKCINCGSTDLTPAKQFSLMVKSNIGSPTDALSEDNVVYLRPETCGGIYLEYKNTMDSLHPSLPFGIAQVGKAFRNEIVARQFIFRTREFEQMEMQYFLHPRDMETSYKMWQQTRWDWYLKYGIPVDKLRWYKHEKLAHYASEAYDIEFNFRSLGGFKEVEGVHARGDWDLSQHSKHSGADLTYFDEKTQERFIPHIMETSVGLGRLFLMFIDNAYTEEEIAGNPRAQGAEQSSYDGNPRAQGAEQSSYDGEMRTVLKLDRRLAPVKAAIFPLLRNKPELVGKAREIYSALKGEFMCEFDDNGNIGKRYRRQDEIGTPFCVTVDFQTLDDNTVTIRDRDTAKQERISIAQLAGYLSEKLT